MGRRKLPMELIKNEKARSRTLTKRIKGLKKKAYELSKLCSIDTVLIVAGPDNSLETWPETSPELNHVVKRYMNLSKPDREKYAVKLGQKSPKMNSTVQDNEIMGIIDQEEIVPVLNYYPPLSYAYPSSDLMYSSAYAYNVQQQQQQQQQLQQSVQFQCSCNSCLFGVLGLGGSGISYNGLFDHQDVFHGVSASSTRFEFQDVNHQGGAVGFWSI
ncbi:agamous-like MADS-box protein AGL103 [Dioscorea cayenensis subsp. rotundata]|uniref:Agamous-like MADS-box protein AGL103 n=1 Tax=Dioscorea cayennensis subsp. rotundata TaxID=55577 RepID=A0AB40BA90_DIOCR|nr:agamous-like MADS-box protein AGL103 [Dioscorea cayenensis subsp. rotundata]